MAKSFQKKRNNTELTAVGGDTLLQLLEQKMGGMTRTSIRQLLRARRVQVNGAVESNGSRTLAASDKVTILSNTNSATLHHPKLTIIYEDDNIIIVNKKQGLLTVPTNADSYETTALSILKAYVRRQHPRNNIFVVHRLDRETSGLLVFARQPQLQEYMRTYWRELVTKRTYIALVEGVPEKKKGTITSWFTEDKRNAMVYSSPVDDGGQKAVTHYEVLKESAEQNMSLVALNLETGRTNQIRVHMASIGHPVVGDRKYGNGNTFSPMDRLCLHAKVLEFINPATEQTVHFESPVPREFKLKD